MFKSTRSEYRVLASQAILEGIAPDGGLFVFDETPTINIGLLVDYDYQTIAKKLITLLLDDYSENEINSIVDVAYVKPFASKPIIGCNHYNQVTFLELFHGPTLSFKDYGLMILPHLIIAAKEKHKINAKHIVLTATSGDTGSATLAGFYGIKSIKTIVLYPYQRISSIQEQQMLHYQSDDQVVIAIGGNFDDAQRFVKNKFVTYNHLLSANSINIGRLIPQIVYYFYGYIQMVKDGKITLNQDINVCVPTGNFGNIYAAYLAKKMGLPIKKLICASNENNNLTHLFKTGIYDVSKPLIATNTPSMDITQSSNLERLMYNLTSKEEVNRFVDALIQTKRYIMPHSTKEKLKDFYGAFCTQKEVNNIINQVYQETKTIIDPHTAVAYGTYQKYQKETSDQTKTLVVSTAHWAKFPETISRALHKKMEDVELTRQWKKKSRIVWQQSEMEEKFNKLYGELLCLK